MSWALLALAVMMPTTETVHVEEWPTAVAGVDRGVGLDQALEIL